MKTTTPIYNGLTIRQILKNLPKKFSRPERNQYLKNCVEVFKNETAGINAGYNESLRNSNFWLIQYHTQKR